MPHQKLLSSVSSLRIFLIALVIAITVNHRIYPKPDNRPSPSVEVEYQTPMEVSGGISYVYAEGVMMGKVERDDGTSGRYKVPIILVYPEVGGNGVGVVDIVNSAVLRLLKNDEGQPHECGRGNPFECEDGITSGIHIENLVFPMAKVGTDGFLFREGYTYMAVQWDNAVTSALGPEPPYGTRRHLVYGSIEQLWDFWDILADASRWLRDPENFTGIEVPQIEAQETLIASGYSQTGYLLRTWLFDGFNEAPGGNPYFDGFFIKVAGARCIDREEPCPGPPPTEHAKVIALDAQGDVEFIAGAHARDPNHGTDGENPNYIRWELAGTSHIPQSIFEMTPWGGDGRQNPLDFKPVIRAGFHHLTNWIVDGTPPPPTRHIEGTLDDEGEWTAVVDDDGNALGGIRLPNLPRTLEDGTMIGAPLGVYNGVYWKYMPPLPEMLPGNYMAALGGLFEPFSGERLGELYPTPEIYEKRFIAALDELLAEGYILEEDYEHMRQLAEGIGIPDPPELSDSGEDFDENDAENLHLPEGGEVRLELVHQTGLAPEVRTHAWFADSQVPESMNWPRPPDNWHEQDGPGLCRDLRGGGFYPTDEPEYRNYLDVGNEITITNREAEIVLGRYLAVQDRVAHLWHDVLYINDIRPYNLKAGTTYDIHIPGSDEFPEMTYQDALYLPSSVDPLFPDMEQEQVIMPAYEDFLFISRGLTDDPNHFTTVTFIDHYGPAGFCIGPRSGLLTVPSSFLDKMPDHGTLQYGHLTYGSEEHNGRRIDFVGVNARETVYVINRARP